MLHNELETSLLFTSYSTNKYDLSAPLAYIRFNTEKDEISSEELGLIKAYINGTEAGVEVEGKFNCDVTQIDEAFYLQDFKLFPNPSSEEITLQLPKGETAQIKIVDGLGKLVYSQRVINLKSNHQKQLNIREFKPGIYQVVVDVDGVLLKSILIKE